MDGSPPDSSVHGMFQARILEWQRDQVEREVGREIGMGNTCISKADSCQCMTKTTTIL